MRTMSAGPEKSVDSEGHIFYILCQSLQVINCMTFLKGGGTMKTTKCSSIRFSGLLSPLRVVPSPKLASPPHRPFPVRELSEARMSTAGYETLFSRDDRGLGNLIDTFFGISSNVVSSVLEVN
jgi:hypothetical protein